MKRAFEACLSVFMIICLAAYAHPQESVRHTPVVKVVKEWSPSVVNISTERTVLLRYHPFWGRYGGLFDESYKQMPSTTIGTMNLKSVGSGVVISDDGLILTNAHVVNMASSIFVILSDGSKARATVESVNTQDDLALVKISPPGQLKPVHIANDIMVGETVVSIGNPFGLENSATAGIVSAVNRKFLSGTNVIFSGLIQTDAPINPGSSGGALFNMDGELVGLNLAVVQNAQSIGFAIPFSRIKDAVSQYEQGKTKVKVIKIPVE